jgi:hypothetical protein
MPIDCSIYCSYDVLVTSSDITVTGWGGATAIERLSMPRKIIIETTFRDKRRSVLPSRFHALSEASLEHLMYVGAGR